MLVANCLDYEPGKNLKMTAYNIVMLQAMVCATTTLDVLANARQYPREKILGEKKQEIR